MSSSYLQILEELLAIREGRERELQKSELAKGLRASGADLIKVIEVVAQSGDLSLMVGAEKFFLEYRLSHGANSLGEKNSLRAAIRGMDTIAEHIAVVANPMEYKIIDRTHKLPENREKGLPIDEAREAFRKHLTRFRNADQTGLSEDEKSLLNARRNMIKVAQSIYIGLQQEALALVLGSKARLAGAATLSTDMLPALPASVLRMFLTKQEIENSGDAPALSKDSQQTLASNVMAHDAAMRKNEGLYFDVFWKEQFCVGRDEARKRLVNNEGCFEQVEELHQGLLVLLSKQLVTPQERMNSVIRRYAQTYSNELLNALQGLNPNDHFEEFPGYYMDTAALDGSKQKTETSPKATPKPQPPKNDDTMAPGLMRPC